MGRRDRETIFAKDVPLKRARHNQRVRVALGLATLLAALSLWLFLPPAPLSVLANPGMWLSHARLTVALLASESQGRALLLAQTLLTVFCCLYFVESLLKVYQIGIFRRQRRRLLALLAALRRGDAPAAVGTVPTVAAASQAETVETAEARWLGPFVGPEMRLARATVLASAVGIVTAFAVTLVLDMWVQLGIFRNVALVNHLSPGAMDLVVASAVYFGSISPAMSELRTVWRMWPYLRPQRFAVDDQGLRIVLGKPPRTAVVVSTAEQWSMARLRYLLVSAVGVVMLVFVSALTLGPGTVRLILEVVFAGVVVAVAGFAGVAIQALLGRGMPRQTAGVSRPRDRWRLMWARPPREVTTPWSQVKDLAIMERTRTRGGERIVYAVQIGRLMAIWTIPPNASSEVLADHAWLCREITTHTGRPLLDCSRNPA